MKSALVLIFLLAGISVHAGPRDLAIRYRAIADRVRVAPLSPDQAQQLELLAQKAESILGAPDDNGTSINPVVQPPNASFSTSNSGSCSGNSLMGGYYFIYHYNYIYVNNGNPQTPQLQLQTQGTLGTNFVVVDNGIFKKYVIYKNENFLLATPSYPADKILFRYVPSAQTQKYIDFYGNDWRPLCDMK